MKDRNMSDTSEESVKTGIKPRNKKGFREPTSLHVDPSLWQEVRVMAVLKGVSVTEYFEDALRKKIDADNREAGKGYRVGQGGMYIPPPPQTQQQDSKTRTAQNRLTKTRDEYASWEVEKLLAGGKEVIEEQPQQEYKRNIHHYMTENSTDKNRTHQQQQKSDLFNEDGALIVPGTDDYFTMLWLPGVEFPTNTKDLIKSYWSYIEKSFDKSPMSNFKQKFSNKNRKYRNKEELEEDLRMMFDIDKKNKGKSSRMINIILISDKDKTEADQNFVKENFKRLKEMSDGLVLGKRE